jgi:inward rectifier potassium channel
MARPGTPTTPSGNTLSYQFRVIGGARPQWRDLYHQFLQLSWWAALGLIVAAYLVLNAAFGALYALTGGIEHAAPGSFLDGFFFSVQTMGTIGYGAMYPTTRLANALVTTESVLGLLVTALATGMVFVRFSRIRGRVVFSQKVAIAPMDGVPTVQIRVGNARSNRIYDVDLRLSLTRTIRTHEGVTIYRTEDLKLVRERAPTLMQSWMLLHRIDASSPLHGLTPEVMKSADAEISLSLTGTDDISLQPIHGRYTWEHFDMAWGHRLADVLSEDPDGTVVLDLSKFHVLEPAEPTEAFPYPAPAAKA